MVNNLESVIELFVLEVFGFEALTHAATFFDLLFVDTF